MGGLRHLSGRSDSNYLNDWKVQYYTAIRTTTCRLRKLVSAVQTQESQLGDSKCQRMVGETRADGPRCKHGLGSRSLSRRSCKAEVKQSVNVPVHADDEDEIKCVMMKTF